VLEWNPQTRKISNLLSSAQIPYFPVVLPLGGNGHALLNTENE